VEQIHCLCKLEKDSQTEQNNAEAPVDSEGNGDQLTAESRIRGIIDTRALGEFCVRKKTQSQNHALPEP